MPVRKLEARSEVPLGWRNVGWSQHETRTSDREGGCEKTASWFWSFPPCLAKPSTLTKVNQCFSPIRSSRATSPQKQSSPRNYCTWNPQQQKHLRHTRGSSPRHTQLYCRGTACYWKCGLKVGSSSELGQQHRAPSSPARPAGKMLAGQPGVSGVVSCPSD